MEEKHEWGRRSRDGMRLQATEGGVLMGVEWPDWIVYKMIQREKVSIKAGGRVMRNVGERREGSMERQADGDRIMAA